jgi:hypothetical protein
LQYYAATRISSASECFAGICGIGDTTWNQLFMFLEFISLDRKSYWHLGPATLWKRLMSQALLKDISVARLTVHVTNWLI